ncbi:MAG: hydroxymyristoyl-ACP dehydratase [Bacteroidia bacterium]|nr:hydroxymyristoyl-ACP dehydratase [Bacteroidia bacterium]
MDENIKKYILENLPYSKPFLFVDNIISYNENEITGTYTFDKEEFFYKGHFKNDPVTPGLILVECMGQIGLVGFALALTYPDFNYKPMLSFVESEFSKSVYPSDKVTVISKKVYFRNNILKCNITMTNSNNEEVAKTTAILTLVETK